MACTRSTSPCGWCAGEARTRNTCRQPRLVRRAVHLLVSLRKTMRKTSRPAKGVVPMSPSSTLICAWLTGSHHRLISGGVRGRLTVPPILTMCRCAAQCVHVASAGEREVEDKEWQWQGCEERRLPGLDRHRQENAPFMTTRAAASRPKCPKREGETPAPMATALGKEPDVDCAQ